jgi:hypothetical protein
VFIIHFYGLVMQEKKGRKHYAYSPLIQIHSCCLTQTLYKQSLNIPGL